MKKIICAMALSLAPILTQAMIAPYYFKGEEIKAILDSSEIATKVKMGFIKSITETNNQGGYTVVAGSCAVNVQVSRQSLSGPTARPVAGLPSKILLSISAAKCK